MSADPFTTVDAELPRDRWGRPLITPPEGGDPVAYQRVTTFVGALEDTYHLSMWQKRMVAYGMSKRRDLQLAAAAIKDPKDRFQKRTLNEIAESAVNAAQGDAAAITGTALHTMTEAIDRGEELDYVPEEHERDLSAYREAIDPFEVVAIEGFCVRDDLRVGGSYDRIIHVPKDEGLVTPDGAPFYGNAIWDLKTGGSVGGGLFGIGKIAMQLGVYANSVDYEHALGTRTPLPDVRTDWAIVCHLPAGSGQAQLLWVDIAAGWTAARDLAPGVHAWRKRRDLSASFRTIKASEDVDSLPARIARASSYAELQALHREHVDIWTPGLTSLAAARKAEILDAGGE